jgi:hypothetical protein
MDRTLLGKAHHPELDSMSPAQIRVVCEHLLYTMEISQRRKLMAAFPGLYKNLFPNCGIKVIDSHGAELNW